MRQVAISPLFRPPSPSPGCPLDRFDSKDPHQGSIGGKKTSGTVFDKDQIRNVGGHSFPTGHLDPAGRWVVPADGRYLILVRNLIGGQRTDPRRVYRLSIRREEPEFSLAVIPHRSDPVGLNIARGGRSILDVLAIRRRGLTGHVGLRNGLNRWSLL